MNRFPAAMVTSMAGTLAMVLWVNMERAHRHDVDPLWKITLAATLGITLFLSLKVFCEVKGYDAKKSRWLHIVAFAVLALYFVTLLDKLKGADFYRFYLINADLHLLVAIAPFLFERNLLNAFWQYNKTLFIRIGVSAIYSSTIYIGLVIAIVCLDKLFNLRIDEKIYFQLWLMVMGVFNTWFFLGGVPKNIRTLETDESYPKGLRIFTQFVLVPLVVLYYAILYLYMAKIIFTWNLPVGWLSSFIIGASLLGILTLLLIYPLRNRSEFGWIKTYARYFYMALLPLVVLMAVAIFRRIFDYGITIERYFVLLFTVWLFYISIKFTVRPETSIRIIPTSMCLLIVMATFGPLSAVSVSSKSQLGRLEYYLEKTGYLQNKTLIKGKRKMVFKDSAEISSIVEYLHNMHGLEILNRWAKKGEDFKYLNQFSFCQDYLGIDFIGRYQRGERDNQTMQYYFGYNAQQAVLRDLRGFDYLYDLQGIYRMAGGLKKTVATPDGNLEIFFPDGKNALEFRKGQNVLVIDFDPALARLRETKGSNGYSLTSDELTFDQDNEDFRIKLVLSAISGNYQNEIPKVETIYGQLYVKFKGKE